jgi:hypothetical protein
MAGGGIMPVTGGGIVEMSERQVRIARVGSGQHVFDRYRDCLAVGQVGYR